MIFVWDTPVHTMFRGKCFMKVESRHIVPRNKTVTHGTHVWWRFYKKTKDCGQHSGRLLEKIWG